jgi:hypothetical protein
VTGCRRCGCWRCRTAGVSTWCGMCPRPAGRCCWCGRNGSGTARNRPALCTWSETSEQIRARATLTERAADRRVGHDRDTMAAIGRELGVGWNTVMRAVRDHGTPLVEDPARLDGVVGVRPHVSFEEQVVATNGQIVVSPVSGSIVLPMRPV